MTDRTDEFDRDDELRALLTGADPARALRPADPAGVARLLEDTMSHDTQTRPDHKLTRLTGTHNRNPLTWLVAAAAVIVIAGVSVFAAARITADDPITIGTTPITFAQVGAGSSPYTAGNGLVLSGQDFNVGAGTGIITDADAVRVDTNVVARKYAADCVATTNPQNFAHGLGIADLQVTVREKATGVVVYPDITITTTNITVDFGAAPTAGQYRVTAVG